ncbi:MAG: coenzyme F420-0:L-glutamate ligase, partial [Nitrosopumilus sp.]|nr:coenzyme F420-0:L-glutamate ligase [Nitrosopumilus sp.]
MQILPVHIEKEITPDDNLSKIIINSADIDDGDILVIAQKVISKQEGRIVDLSSVKTSLLSEGISSQYNKDPRIVELILSESKRIVRMKSGL